MKTHCQVCYVVGSVVGTSGYDEYKGRMATRLKAKEYSKQWNRGEALLCCSIANTNLARLIQYFFQFYILLSQITKCSSLITCLFNHYNRTMLHRHHVLSFSVIPVVLRLSTRLAKEQVCCFISAIQTCFMLNNAPVQRKKLGYQRNSRNQLTLSGI